MLLTYNSAEPIDLCTRIRRSLARFSGLESLTHTRYSADFITTMSAFEFSVHTGLHLCGCRLQPHPHPKTASVNAMTGISPHSPPLNQTGANNHHSPPLV